MSKVLFQITPLSCPGCGKQIHEKLMEQDGVIIVKVFPRLGRIRTEFDEAKTNAAHLEGLIGSWGHAVELKKLKRGYENDEAY
ncbi:copper chaperone [Desulfitobacterium dehalogenans ATCC 51507]|uniref:Copper chaperone n=1 Tax=Desulfitobacterium dehalogenans (strain ATCC 51507 / DSM 9161 / JW/IU-DC1) TaxID=756499 RepID=I4A8E4_DESDJ|nr:heavy-metal-associated domain-containing protein [Desulfitobacterium dehalogenans]AFM00229.1 copper chaperone [Desulfitobacterium dehalogenans ATCC 51507]